jgi:hypothetical protein
MYWAANPPTKNAPIEQKPAIISTFLSRALLSVGPGRAAMRQSSVHFQQSIPAPSPRAIETMINEVCMVCHFPFAFSRRVKDRFSD